MCRTRVLCVLMILTLLCSCGAAGGTDSAQDKALAIRTAYLSAQGCTARLDVTADYGQRVYTYTVDVSVTEEETVITVVEPQEVAGVTARLRSGQSMLEYDGLVLETGPLSDTGLTPLGAVPAMLDSARTGFMDSSTMEPLGEQQTLRVLCRDPAREIGSGQETTLWFDPETKALLQGELMLDGRRVILCKFSQFLLT